MSIGTTERNNTMQHDIIPSVNTLDLAMHDIAGQLSPASRRIYLIDARHFADWMRAQGLTPETMTRSHLIAYRQFLSETTQPNGKTYSKSSLQRMFSIACRLMNEQALVHQTERITQQVKGFKVQGDETTHTALSKEQARDMLSHIDTRTAKGRRDYALLLLLVKTGIRRAECVALNRADIRMMDGHHVAVIEHGKGDKKRVVKLRVDVFRALESYMNAVHLTAESPLFVAFHKSDRPTTRRLTDKTIERIVGQHAPAHTDLTPHGLRATFATLALENGAALHQVQYALGHADPRTTERYQKRKLNLDNNAVDVLNF
jgi:integrase/recombinase XerD